MAKGQIAKDNVIQKIISALGDDFIGEFDKKFYCWADDGGERVQISIALTCPKVYRGIEETSDSVLSFDDDGPAAAANAPSGFSPAEITQQEQDTLAALMERLGI